MNWGQSILRQIVAGPRARHPEANLDLCYVTEKIIATSGPSATYPSLAYRNPLNELVAFLDSRHGENWCIWEFRAEGTGYPDEEVYNRIWHFPWPDHHPPPFALVPRIMASMRNWLHTEKADTSTELEHKQGRVVVVHCKAGKGRSGTMAISYLITHEGWAKADALARFTQRRMRQGFGAGISIPSQLRWIDYVERWSGIGGRIYVERAVEVTEVHVWGLRDGVKISVEGYVEEGRKIKTYHVFDASERDDQPEKAGFADVVQGIVASRGLRAFNKGSSSRSSSRNVAQPSTSNIQGSDAPNLQPASTSSSSSFSEATTNTVFRPSKPIILESSDINLAVEKRAAGWNTVTSVAHVWFNCFFEGEGPENYASSLTEEDQRHRSAPETDSAGKASGEPWAASSGVFTIDFDAMDGIKGSSRKGVRAFEKVAVVWRAVGTGNPSSRQSDEEKKSSEKPDVPAVVIPEPQPHENVSPVRPADWRGSQPIIKAKGPAKAGVAQDELARGKNAAEGEASDSEDGAEGIRRGVLT